ncbi:hypothetical protein P0E20_004256 [Vibrio harveyi]|uniref:ADP-ribosyltransferase domain-containing protein n=1 Tax=Vibrio harveyi TaxID=669 RepID=UPI00165E0EF3|nr:ADP-ribosyltransferase domain-containing protein [Vibrio harveyi]EKO3870263.1 hypothetical protein [Vibrio harveyi]
MKATNKVTNELSSLLNFHNVDKEKTIPEKIKQVYNLKKLEHVTIGNINKLIDAASLNISNGRELIKDLDSISNKNFDDIIRLKNGRLKSGEPSNFVKKLFNGGRYKSERKSAVELFGCNSQSITTSKAQKLLVSQLKEVEKEKTGLSEQKESAMARYEQLENLESMLRAEPCTSKVKIGEKGVREKDNAKIRSEFSLIYQTNSGCAALNNHALNIYGNSSLIKGAKTSDIINEYVRCFGNEIFEKGNKEVKKDIKTLSENMPELVKNAAQAFFTPSKTNTKTMRGCGMTENGINALFDAQKNKTTYRLSKFFSTTGDKDIANKFAEDNSVDGKAKVLFTVKGNSGNSVIVNNGLQFGDNERERLYSPLAHFVVTHASKLGATYHFTLQEVSKTCNAEILPH